jgi:hypothetical protein
MKTKYDRMNKKQKKNLLIKYKKTDKGSMMMQRLLRLNIIGIAGILFSIYLFIDSFDDLSWLDYLSIIPLFIASLIFLIMSYVLRKKVLNQFAIKNK